MQTHTEQADNPFGLTAAEAGILANEAIVRVRKNARLEAVVEWIKTDILPAVQKAVDAGLNIVIFDFPKHWDVLHIDVFKSTAHKYGYGIGRHRSFDGSSDRVTLTF